MNAFATITPSRAALVAVLFALAGCNSSDGKDGSGDMTGGAPSVGGGGGTTSASGVSGGGGTTTSAGGATSANGGTSSAAGGTPSAGGVPTMTGAGGGQGLGGRPGGDPGATGGASSPGGAAGTTGGAGPGGAAGAGGCTPNTACMPTAPSSGDIYQDCVDRVNQFRACMCLPPLKRWNDGEACANQDASYDAMNQSMGAHAGFKAKICAAGNAQDECPGYRSNTQVVSGCLQQMFNEGPPPMTPCTDTCYQQHGHFINMTNTRYTMIACGYYTNTDGKVWAVQNFK